VKKHIGLKMNKTAKKILIWSVSIIGIAIIGYLTFIGTVLYTLSSGCGMDDGPFKAILIDPITISDSAQVYDLSKNGKLILENRLDTLSPVITLIENGKVKWTLDTDVSNTKGYEGSRIWNISDVEVTKNTDPIRLKFVGYWTFGAEVGSIEIDRENGDNSFCLSW
jgi:hypothetical protein